MTRELDERLRAAMARDDVGALVDVGCDLADVDRQADALVCFQRAVVLGDELMWFNVGNTLRELDRPLEAIDAYEKALAAGETDAWLNLGLVLESVGDLAGAMTAYRAAWDAGGQPEGYVNLALASRRQGLREEAEATLTEAADREHAGAARRGRGQRGHPGVAGAAAPRDGTAAGGSRPAGTRRRARAGGVLVAAGKPALR